MTYTIWNSVGTGTGRSRELLEKEYLIGTEAAAVGGTIDVDVN